MKQESIIKNYGYKLIYQIITFMVPLVSTPYLSRVFGAEGIGVYSYTNALASYFILFAALGTEIYGAVEIAKVRDNKKILSSTFYGIVVVRFMTTSFSLVIWLIYTFLSNKYEIYYLVLSIQILAVSVDIAWFYEGLEKYKIIVLRNIIIRFLNLLFLFVFIKDKKDLALYIIALGLFTLLGNISLWSDLKGKFERVQISDLGVKRHIKGTIVYFIPTIATSVYTVLDKAMIGWITHSEQENGYYEQASTIVTLVKKVAVTLPVVMRTRMTYLYVNNKIDELKEKLQISFNFISCIAIVLSFGLVGVAKQFVPWYFGEGYSEVVSLIYIKSPLILIIATSMCIGEECLTPSGQRGRSSKAIIIGSVCNFLLNILLIPLLGAQGAAIASVLAEALIMLLYINMGNEFMKFQTIWRCVWKKIMAAAVMLVFLLVVFDKAPAKWYITIFQMLSGGIVYVLLLFIMKDSILFDISLIIRKVRKK